LNPIINNEPTQNDIKNALKHFAERSLADNARHLLDIPGYRSERTMSLDPNTADEFINHFDLSKTMKTEIRDFHIVFLGVIAKEPRFK